MGYSAVHPAQEGFDVPPQGMKKWELITGNAVYSSPAIGLDGTIYIGSDDGKLYAVDSTTGVTKWTFTESWPPPQSFRAAPLVGPDGTIYVRRSNGYLYAINPNGTLKWKTQIYYDTYVSSAISRDGNIYVAGWNPQQGYANCLHAISPEGNILWSYNTGNTIYSSPAVAADGTVYFGSMDSKLHAVDPAQPQAFRERGLNHASHWGSLAQRCIPILDIGIPGAGVG